MLTLVSKAHYLQDRRPLMVSLEVLNRLSENMAKNYFKGVLVSCDIVTIHWDAYFLVQKDGISLQGWVAEILFEAAEEMTHSRYPIEAKNFLNFQEWLLQFI